MNYGYARLRLSWETAKNKLILHTEMVIIAAAVHKENRSAKMKSLLHSGMKISFLRCYHWNRRQNYHIMHRAQ